MESNTKELSRPARGKLTLYFIFAWLISVVFGFSTISALYFFDIKSGGDISWKAAIVLIVLNALGYGSGAFVLGTLTPQRIKIWTKAVVYVIPFFLVRGLIFATSNMNDPMKEELLAKPISMIVVPVISLLISPLIAFYFIRIGEESAGEFSRPKSALNIPWQHWLWVLPFFLTQVIGVPLFLLLALWKIDLLTANVSFSILSLPALIPRMIVFFIFSGILMSINAAYTALTEDYDTPGIRAMKVIGTWVLLTTIQVFIVLAAIGKFMV